MKECDFWSFKIVNLFFKDAFLKPKNYIHNYMYVYLYKFGEQFCKMNFYLIHLIALAMVLWEKWIQYVGSGRSKT